MYKFTTDIFIDIARTDKCMRTVHRGP